MIRFTMILMTIFLIVTQCVSDTRPRPLASQTRYVLDNKDVELLRESVRGVSSYLNSLRNTTTSFGPERNWYKEILSSLNNIGKALEAQDVQSLRQSIQGVNSYILSLQNITRFAYSPDEEWYLQLLQNLGNIAKIKLNLPGSVKVSEIKLDDKQLTKQLNALIKGLKDLYQNSSTYVYKTEAHVRQDNTQFALLTESIIGIVAGLRNVSQNDTQFNQLIHALKNISAIDLNITSPIHANFDFKKPLPIYLNDSTIFETYFAKLLDFLTNSSFNSSKPLLVNATADRDFIIDQLYHYNASSRHHIFHNVMSSNKRFNSSHTHSYRWNIFSGLLGAIEDLFTKVAMCILSAIIDDFVEPLIHKLLNILWQLLPIFDKLLKIVMQLFLKLLCFVINLLYILDKEIKLFELLIIVFFGLYYFSSPWMSVFLSVVFILLVDFRRDIDLALLSEIILYVYKNSTCTIIT